MREHSLRKICHEVSFK